MVVAWAAHRHKTKFFFLLQVEEGDVFKLAFFFLFASPALTRRQADADVGGGSGDARLAAVL
jgi:hypothetical protein